MEEQILENKERKVGQTEKVNNNDDCRFAQTLDFRVGHDNSQSRLRQMKRVRRITKII
jgi:hypothetical protein